VTRPDPRHTWLLLSILVLSTPGSGCSSGKAGASKPSDAGSSGHPTDAGGDGGEADAATDAADGADAPDGFEVSLSADGGALIGTIYSGVPWLDTSGRVVNAHGPGFLKIGTTYYMIGEQRSGLNDSYSGAPINAEDTFTGVNLYSTTDFAHWTFVGTVVQPIAGTVVAPPYYGERPKVLYNASTGNYVIYIKMLNYTGSPPNYVGYFAVLTSPVISGPYTYSGNLSVAGASDFQVFQDTDGTQYLAQAGGRLYKLSADGRSIAHTVVANVPSGEGVSLFGGNGAYFWQSSQGTYWYANDNSYSTAPALNGPWTSQGYFCPSGTMTWDSQDTAVVPITGTLDTAYLYVGDRWVNGDLPASTLVVQPLTVSRSTESIPTNSPVWNLDLTHGTWNPATPSGTSVNDSATGTGPNQFAFTSDWASVACSTCNGGDEHASSTTGGTATIGFTGTQILLYSAYDGSSGVMGVTLSDASGAALTPEVHVSLRYDAPAAGNALVYASPVLSRGPYSLQVRVTGKADLYSSGVGCNVDRVLVVP
jgi:hypothetical protein